MYLIYNIIIFFIIILYAPVLIYQKLRGNYKEGAKEKFSFLSEEEFNNLDNKSVIWIQAASVGEVMAAEPLIKKLKEKYPHKKIVLSTMTDTGRKTAKKNDLVTVIYFPLDFKWIVKRSLKIINPDLIILIETELWPNFIREAKKINAKIMVASGRISDNSIKSYKYLKPLLQKTLTQIDYFSMQTNDDRNRIIELGAPSSLVTVEGNIKFDRDFNDSNLTVEVIREEFKIEKNQIVVVAGSTHNDEEKRLISVYNKLKDKYPDLVFLIAPRYIDRSKKIKELYKKNNIKTKLRTEISNRKQGEDLIIVNTLGELVNLYKIADLVFVGGSLIEKGGHNILEPAAQKSAVFFGPYMFNFKKDTKYFLKNSAAIQVNDEKELSKKMLELLDDREKLENMGTKAKNLVKKNKGASRKNIQIASKLLAEKEKKNILLVRLSAIGDVIHAMPIAKAIRKKYNKARISWIVENKAIDLVEMNPYLDKVYKFPKTKWKKHFKENKLAALKEIRNFFKEFKKNDFDLVLDVHGLFKSGITTYFSGAQKRYGPVDGREGSKLFYTDILDLPDEKIHQVERNLKLAQSFGAKIDEVDYGLKVPQFVENSLSKKASDWELDLDKFIVINPFTTWESKDWFEERYVSLVEKLLLKYDYEVVFTGGPKDISRIKEIISEIKNSERVLILPEKQI